MISTVSVMAGTNDAPEGRTRFGPLRPAIAGLVALCFVGFLVPDLEYSLADSACFLGLYIVGAVFVWSIGGRQRRDMLSVYCLYTSIACCALLAGTFYGASQGSTSPVFMVDRVNPRDDYNLFETLIRPSIGLRDTSLVGGFSNAPLHWYVNVRIQQLFVAVVGRPQLMVGNGLNIVVGSTTMALIVGAVRLASRPSSSSRFPRGVPLLFVWTCPWLLAASIIAIREIWVYAVFAAAFYGALAASRWTLLFRLPALAALAAVCGVSMALLRAEMMPMVVVLVLLGGLTVQDRPLTTGIEASFVGGILALTALSIAPWIALRADSPSAAMQARAEAYSELADTPEEGEQGTVKSFVSNSFGPRAAFQTLWMPFKPLPKVSITPGSTYQLGKLLMPVWILASFAAGLTMARGEKRAEGTVLRRYRWLILWMLVMTILVGATSAESRHFYVLVPVWCALLSDVFQTRAAGPAQVTRAWRKGALAGGVVLVLSAMFTLAIFGVGALIPSR